jgi:DDE superfamily endonuclease
MNLQASADARGNLLWISGAIRGAIHDTKAARIWQIPRLLAQHGLFALGDKGYEGLDSTPGSDPIRCDPHQVTQIAKAVQVLNDYECGSS